MIHDLCSILFENKCMRKGAVELIRFLHFVEETYGVGTSECTLAEDFRPFFENVQEELQRRYASTFELIVASQEVLLEVRDALDDMFKGSASAKEACITQVMQVSGVDRETAAWLLDKSDGDANAALRLHFS